MSSKKQSETRQLATSGIILVAASFVVRFIGFFYRIPLTNLWGDEGNDAYSMAYQIYNLCIIISSFGVPATISRMVGKRLALGEYANAKKVLRSAIGVISLITLVCALFLWFGNVWIATAIFGVPEAALAIRVQAPTLIIVALMAILRGFFQGMNNMKPTAVSQVLEQIVNALTSLLFAFMLFGRGLEWGVAGGISGALFGGLAALLFLLLCYMLYKKTTWVGSKKSASRYATETTRVIVKEMLLLLVPIVLATSVMNIKSIIDSSLFMKLMVWKGYASDDVSAMRGIYQGKFVLLTTLPIAIGNALGTASVPSITKSITLRDQEGVEKKVHLQFKTILLLELPAAVGLAIIAKPLLNLLYPAASAGYELFWVGFLQVVFYSVVHVSTGILQGIDKVNLPVKNALIAAVFALIVNIFCIVVLDLKVYALVINDLVFSGILAYLDAESVCRYGRIRIAWWSLLKGPLISTAVMAAACFVVMRLVQIVMGSNLLTVALAVIAAVIVYFVVLVNIGGLTEEDMDNLPMGRKLALFRIGSRKRSKKKRKSRKK